MEPSTGTAAAQPRTGPVLPPAPPVRRPIRGWTAGVLALLVMGGLLLAWLPGALRPDPVGENRRHRRRPAPAPGSSPTRTERPRPGAPGGGTGTTRPAPSTSREPATTRPAPSTRKDLPPPKRPHPPRGSFPGGCRPGGGCSPTGPATTASASRPGSRPGPASATTPRSWRNKAAPGGCSPSAPRPSAPLPQASRDYRAWARRNLAGFREVRYVEDQTYAGHRPAVVFEYQAVRDGRGPRPPHQPQGPDLGLQRRVHRPRRPVGRLPALARQFEQAFQPLG